MTDPGEIIVTQAVLETQIRSILGKYFSSSNQIGEYKPRYTPAAKEIAALLRLESTQAQAGEVGAIIERLLAPDYWVSEDGTGGEKMNPAPVEAASTLLALQEQKVALVEALGEARAIILRYRQETPLGNQPSMIAHKADELIARCDALSVIKGGEG